MNYLPFDLETALKHPERLVTRDGRIPIDLHYFKNKCSSDYKVYADVNGEIFTYTINGSAIKGEQRERDLFLLPEVKECWVNVYEESFKADENIVFFHETKSNAISKIAKQYTYIKTIRITNQPE